MLQHRLRPEPVLLACAALVSTESGEQQNPDQPLTAAVAVSAAAKDAIAATATAIAAAAEAIAAEEEHQQKDPDPAAASVFVCRVYTVIVVAPAVSSS